MAKTISAHDFLTDTQIGEAMALWKKHRATPRAFNTAVVAKVILPNMDEINRKLGQENDARYLAYALEYIFMKAKIT
jgi:hypothetical protein